MASERCLVLGSNSCAGSHFIDYALKQGADVLATSRSAENPQRYLAYLKGSVEYRRLNLNSGKSEISKVLKDFQPTSVINFASQSMVAESWVSPEDWITTNNLGLLALLKALETHELTGTYIHFSTPEVYGSVTGRIDETTAFNPSTPYAATRALGDRFVTMWHHNHDVPAIITRAGNIYGRGQRPYRIIPKTFYSIFKNIKIPLHGGGVSKRNFVHGHDSASALWLLLQQGTVGQTYHISSDEYVSIHDLVNKIAGLFGKETTDVCEVAPERVGKDVDYSLGDLKLRNIGWRQMVSLEKGLEEVRSDIRTHLNDISNDELSYIHQK